MVQLGMRVSCSHSRRGRLLQWTDSRLAVPSSLAWQIPCSEVHSVVSAGCQAQSLDLVFMLDASASVGPENFAQMQSFVRSCALQFDVNPDVTQIGLVVYGSHVQTAFGLDTHVTRAAVLRAMSQAPYLGGAGSAGTALLHVYDKVMTVKRGARPGVPKAVVVLTGGRGVEDAAVPAQKLRDNGVSVLVVGVGPVLREALRRLAGPRDALIHAAAYADLRYHREALLEWLCGGKWGNPHPSEGPPSPLSSQGFQLLLLLSVLSAPGSVLKPKLANPSPSDIQGAEKTPLPRQENVRTPFKQGTSLGHPQVPRGLRTLGRH